MGPSQKLEYGMNMSVYSQLVATAADMKAAFAKVDAACLEGEQCMSRLTAMMQAELSPQERARLNKSAREAMAELQQLKRLAGERKESLDGLASQIENIEKMAGVNKLREHGSL
ncbi:hypothetical protein PHYSODRAFT_295305 [Phytophthora sojae]|uniref:Uncharacterized protein n=1 Tax=Phytophthora sojae (strain P6497) TaxID=1094619 RepID=G4YNN9_PHYSP|nr:hypothetical protein PHYSODRAFT_295305 [Phytophthora sojae]EGZ30544.1 hypothetical protein PHYSODRAFT_295305 [Phytophthora sojae]|eukprot:XP_009517819.1 hypothetical protein PHYSODRAFT_295305 [Phytophthora sojae]